MPKRRGLCYIDDEEGEVSRVSRVLSQHFDIGAGPDLDTAVSRLGRKPQLFVLDMYYGPKTKASDRVRVADGWRELHAKQAEFYELLRSLGQSSRGGFELAAHVRARYPGTPVVFFTRKGSVEDADQAFREGAVAVLKKPDAPNGAGADAKSLAAALDGALESHKDELVRALARVADRYSWWARHARLRGFLEGVAASLLAGLLLLVIDRWVPPNSRMQRTSAAQASDARR